MSFNTGLSALRAASKEMDVTGNNISNVATTGFKSSRGEFADVYSAVQLGSTRTAIGSGVRLANVSQQFTQGAMRTTGNVLDMAIQGQGFFTLSENGSRSFTRAGTFKADKDGYITQTDGTARLQGYGVDSNARIINGVLTDLRIDTSNLAPKATRTVSSTINLNATAPIINDSLLANRFDPGLPATYTRPFTTAIYDSQGNEHTLEQYMVKSAGNSWKMYTLVDGRNPDGSLPTKTGTTSDPVASTITFDSSGKLLSVSTPNPPGAPTVSSDLKLTGWVPGKLVKGVWTANGASANPAGISISLAKTTQFNADTARKTNVQDGYATGQLTNLTIDGSGVLLTNFSNGQTNPIGQVALASFASEQGLQPVGGSAWKETFASGQPSYDAPQAGTLGSLVSGSLEESNINLTNELVNLIKAQNHFKASAKIISTESTLIKAVIDLK